MFFPSASIEDSMCVVLKETFSKILFSIRLLSLFAMVLSENDVLKNPERYTMRQISPEKVKAACEKLLKSNWKISDIQINEDLISHIFSEAQQKYEEFLNDFMEKIKDKSFTELSATQKGNVRKIIERERQATKIAEKDRDIAEQKAKYAAEQADRTQQLFEAEKRRSSFLS